ncbi:MAG: YicC family protein [Sedimentisphaerales bacterium]|nr:YicC family protein [Sedimentisphaerales bacterium]
MINSMTGYGNAEGRLDDVTYVVEIGTVNNRYFKATLRLPETLEFLEGDIEKQLRQYILRGTVNYMLRQKGAPAEALFEINEKALGALMKRLGKISPTGGVERELDLGGLLALPGILSPAIPSGAVANRIRRKVLAITKDAIKRLKAMRAAEGRAMAADLGRNCKAIKANLEKIRRHSNASPHLYAEKLRKRVDELLAMAKLKLDDETVSREVAVFADRADISEEIARLDSHLVQFENAIRSNDQAGRKLDFICQEMLREANTIGSKASDAGIVHLVVEIKCRIDRIKEQVQNVE